MALPPHPPQTRTFHRFIRQARPTLDDFKSHLALGVLPRYTLTPAQLRRWRSLSLYDDLKRAREVARSLRERPYKYIAVLEVPVDAPVEQKGDPHHFEIHESDAPPELMRTWWTGQVFPV